MDATRRQRTLRAATLITLGLAATLLVSLDPIAALRDPAWLAMAISLSAWTISENLLLRQDEPADYKAKRNTRLLQASVVVGAVVACVEAFHLPAYALPRATPTVVAGAALLWAGALLRNWSIRALDRHFRYELRVEEGQTLVRRGPYRWIRHPSYLGLLLVIAGAALAMASPLGILAGVGMASVLLHVRIRDEERVLREAFGPVYDDYEQDSWRLVPFVY